MENQNFKNLIIKRKKWIQSSKENKFDFDGIFTGIYNDPSHFIFEILQNAEDANASSISFMLYFDRLEIEHNGREFDFRDVDGITGIGISTKKDDLNSIGKFGVGFKSVFAITKTPIIHSGYYHFKIEYFVIPSLLNKNNSNETIFILPFNHPTRLKDEVYDILRVKLENLSLKNFLFLKSIVDIKWETPEKKGHYYKKFEDFHKNNLVKKVTIVSKIGDEENYEKYIVFKKQSKIDTKLFVEVAYRIDDSENFSFIKEKNANLFVYFPTEKVTYLNFIIHGPYKTTQNRENIPLNDEQNMFLLEETANLVAESISIIKDLGLLNISFLEVLPIDKV